MPRIICPHGDYKLTKSNCKKMLAIFLISQAIFDNVWGVFYLNSDHHGRVNLGETRTEELFLLRLIPNRSNHNDGFHMNGYTAQITHPIEYNEGTIINSGATATVNGDLTSNIPATSTSNNGTLTFGSGKSLYQTGSITNRGSITLSGAGYLTSATSIDNSVSGSKITYGSGSITNTGSGGINNQYGNISGGSGAITSNGGGISNQYGTISGTSAITNTGDINNSSGSITAASLSNTSSITNTSGTITTSGSIANGGSINNTSGSITAASLSNTEDINNTSGTITVSSNGISTNTISSNSGGTINLSGGDLNIRSLTLTNAGTINLSGSASIGAAHPLTSLINSNTITNNSSTPTIILGPLDNSSSTSVLNIANGGVQSNTIDNTAGTINLSGTGDLSITNGIMDNPGTIIFSDSSSIGAVHQVSQLNNTGSITVNGTSTGSKIYATGVNNNSHIPITINGKLQTKNINNTVGTINIGSGGDLSSLNMLPADRSVLNNSINQTINISGTGTIGANNAWGTVTNNGTINANGGNVIVGSLDNSATTSLLNISRGNINIDSLLNTAGLINIGYQNSGGNLLIKTGISLLNAGNIITNGTGDLSIAGIINNSGNLTLLGNSTIGSTLTVSELINTGTITATPTASKIKSQMTNNSSAAVINITDGILQTGNINNTLGTINIGALPATGGDLSSITPGTNASILTNAPNQTINIIGNGTVGATAAIGQVNNNGIIYASGENSKVGAFTNNNIGAALNITKNIMQTGNINNTFGAINVGYQGTAGDLSGTVRYTNTIFNAVDQTLLISGTGCIGKFCPFGVITNNGIFTVEKDASVYASSIIQNGTMNLYGAIHAPIKFGDDGTTINIHGGIIDGLQGSVGNDTLNIYDDFSITTDISMIENINVKHGTFIIDHNISGVTGMFNTDVGATVMIIDNGNISGGGSIQNSGTIQLTKNIIGGTIGTVVPMGDVYNYGTFTASGGDVAVGNFYNKVAGAVLDINSGNIGVNSLINTLGNIAISGGDLSSNIISTTKYGILKNSANQTITIYNNGTIGAVNPFKTVTNVGIINVQDMAVVNLGDFINNYGKFTNNPPTALNINGGKVVVTSLENIAGGIKISGDASNPGDLSSTNLTAPSSLTNSYNQIITISGNGTIGNNAALGTVINNGIINAGGGNIIVGDIMNGQYSYKAAATINIIKGIVRTGNIINNMGAINIFSMVDDLGNKYLGDLSSADPGNPSSLINNTDQIITVASGTIGTNSPLGNITNNGIMNIDNNIAVGKFDNALPGSILHATGGIIKTGNIINSGNIIITSSGEKVDLSSIDPLNPSTLTNQEYAVINVLGKGTVGLNGRLGAVNNNGTINAIGGNMVLGDFNNLATNSSFNISSGNIVIGNIQNNLGSIIMQNGDLSSRDPSNHSSLFNAPGQTITISGNATIGHLANSALGEFINYGIFKAHGGEIIIDSFTNSKTGSASIGGLLDINHGIIKIGSINNNNGSLTIANGDLSGIVANATILKNATNQIITLNETGTIGVTSILREINNNGIINAGGGNIFATHFTNNVSSAILNITSGTVTISDFDNSGLINIGLGNTGGDLSGISNGMGSLTNASNQTIEIGGFGTVGAHNGLGLIINNGIINANTNIFKSLGLNNSKNSIFTITNNNTTGTVNGISLQSINNSGVISVYNNNHDPVHSIQDIHLGKFNNLSGGVFNINGKLTTGNNIINSTDAIININSNFDLGNNAYLLTNNGTVNMLCSATIENGNYLIGTTGSHVTTIDSGIPRTLTLRNGSATLASGSTIDINTTGNTFLQDQQQLTIIAIPSLSVVNDSIIADVNDVKINGNTGIVSYQLSKHNKDIIVTVNRKSIAEIMNSSDNGMAGNAGDLLDNLISNKISDPYLIAALSNIEKLSSKEAIINAVNQLSPSTEIAAVTLATNGVLVPEVVAQRLDFLARAGITHLKTGYAAGGMQIDDGLWIKGIGGTIEQKNFKGFAGYNANTIGVAFGADTRILPNTWIGLGLSSVGTHLKSKDYPAKKTNVSSYQVTAYSSYSPGNYYLDLLGAMAFNNYKTARNIKATDQTATAQFTGVQPSAKISLGYIQQQDGFRIIPNISLQYSTLYQNPYNETGASGTGLQKVSSNNLSQLESGFGVKFAILDNEDSDHLYNPDIHFMVLHDFKAAPQETTAQFIGGGGSFKVQSTAPDKTTYNIGAGMVFMHKNRLDFTANYEWRKKNKFIGHSGSLSVRYEL